MTAIPAYICTSASGLAATTSAIAAGALASLSLAFSLIGTSIALYLRSKNIISMRTEEIIVSSSVVAGLVATVALAFFVPISPIYAASFAGFGIFFCAYFLFR